MRGGHTFSPGWMSTSTDGFDPASQGPATNRRDTRLGAPYGPSSTRALVLSGGGIGLARWRFSDDRRPNSDASRAALSSSTNVDTAAANARKHDRQGSPVVAARSRCAVLTRTGSLPCARRSAPRSPSHRRVGANIWCLAVAWLHWRTSSNRWRAPRSSSTPSYLRVGHPQSRIERRPPDPC